MGDGLAGQVWPLASSIPASVLFQIGVAFAPPVQLAALGALSTLLTDIGRIEAAPIEIQMGVDSLA